MTIDELNRGFAIPGLIRFGQGAGGMTKATITHPQATGEMFLHGAHVTAWHPQGTQPVLWMSKRSMFESDRPIRGGVPICFPWFGPKADDPAAPTHGVARLTKWAVASTSSDEAGVTLQLSTPIALPLRATFSATFGPRLVMTLTVENTGDAPAGFETALHTYFAVGDIRQTRVRGLEAADYLDSLAGRQRKPATGEPIAFAGETDRIYLDSGPATTIDDAAWNRSIRVEKSGSASTVVWNPWVDKAARMPDFGDEEWPSMLCIETANVAQNAVTLPPEGRHCMQATLSVRTPISGQE